MNLIFDSPQELHKTLVTVTVSIKSMGLMALFKDQLYAVMGSNSE